MPLAKRCKLKNSSKNTAKSIVLKVQKSDAPKNKFQLASRGVPRPPGTPLIYVPGVGDFLSVESMEEGKESVPNFMSSDLVPALCASAILYFII